MQLPREEEELLLDESAAVKILLSTADIALKDAWYDTVMASLASKEGSIEQLSWMSSSMLLFPRQPELFGCIFSMSKLSPSKLVLKSSALDTSSPA